MRRSLGRLALTLVVMVSDGGRTPPGTAAVKIVTMIPCPTGCGFLMEHRRNHRYVCPCNHVVACKDLEIPCGRCGAPVRIRVARDRHLTDCPCGGA